ncbi:carbohydrate ABC transporter permease [Lacrimispora brassicae]
MGVKHKTSSILIMIFLTLIAMIQLFPLYWMITFALKGNKEIFGGNIIGLPKVWQWNNFSTVFEQTNIAGYLFNSFMVTIVTIGMTLILSSMITYAIVRLRWSLSKPVYLLFLVGMMLPVHAVLLPLFVNLKPVLNSYLALILPYVAFAMPLAILIMVGALEDLPVELEEAAFIDGASIYKIFFKIILPLLKPTLSTVAILTFLSSWNEMMLAVTFISEERFKTITVGVMDMVGKYSTKWGLIGAGLVVATIPTIIIYILLSDNVQKSLAAGAVKG